MSNNQKLDRMLDRVDVGRRGALRKILAGTAMYTAPVVASFSLDSLGSVAAQSACGNQTGSCARPVPIVPALGLAGLAGLLGAAGALMQRDRDED